MAICPIRLSSFLIKIASRCNLACDYCYMYEHADQGWRRQPALMSDTTRSAVAQRIGEYVVHERLDRICVVFHGGEPLLAGVHRLAETARWIREAVPLETKISFSLQTNGILLTEDAVANLSDASIGISLSIDGSREANDLHRLDHSGCSSFEATLRGLKLLENNRKVYAGLISVVDPTIPPEELFNFFAPRKPPRIDFLLPDAHHERRPPGRDSSPDIYKNWLLRAFDIWFDQYPDLPVRTFDAILATCAGLPSETDAFGFGAPTMLTIETDGSYHDLDVLKITAEGVTSVGMNIVQHPISEAATSSRFQQHAELLRLEGLASTCQRCPEVFICGGGSVPHRYSQSGFCNPTIYCREMLGLIGHARGRLTDLLSQQTPRTTADDSVCLKTWESSESARPSIEHLKRQWVEDIGPEWDEVLEKITENHADLLPYVKAVRSIDPTGRSTLILEPAIRLWTTVMAAHFRGQELKSVAGAPARPDAGYIRVIAEQIHEKPGAVYPRLHRSDEWLRLPFDRDVSFEDEGVASIGREIVAKAIGIIRAWKPSLLHEVEILDPDIQFVRDNNAQPDAIISFSDNSTPGCLYVGIHSGDGFIDPYLLGESIIHEHRHQKLYLLQRRIQMLEIDGPLVKSPWRQDPRPPSGLLHAVFVFVEILAYWRFWTQNGSTAALRHKAGKDCEVISRRLSDAFPILRSTPLTSAGSRLTDILEGVYQLNAACPN